MLIKAVGIDAAFANMGFAHVSIDTKELTRSPFRADWCIRCVGLTLASTEPEQVKTVRKSSDKLRRGQELRAAMLNACADQTFAFAEIPSGTQNANAAFGLGIAVGIMSGCPIPIIEVNPMEVKAAIAGKRVKKGATKAEIIAWAEKLWPDAPWLRAKSRTKTLPAGRLTADNEHLADALATVLAGIRTPEFQRLITLMGVTNAIPHVDNIRPASNSTARRRVSLDIL